MYGLQVLIIKSLFSLGASDLLQLDCSNGAGIICSSIVSHRTIFSHKHTLDFLINEVPVYKLSRELVLRGAYVYL